MTTDQQPAASGQPTVVQQTTVIQVGSRKSVGGAVVLAFFFGPVGMIYATVIGACVMFVVDLFVLFATAGIGFLLTIPLGMLWAGLAASSHNRSLGGVATQAVAQTAPQSPPAWHPDPDGSGRLRYWDGQRWTEHYSEGPSASAAEKPPEAAALEAGGGEVQTESVTCESCGEQIAAEHQFCPSCGTPRPTGA